MAAVHGFSRLMPSPGDDVCDCVIMGLVLLQRPRAALGAAWPQLVMFAQLALIGGFYTGWSYLPTGCAGAEPSAVVCASAEPEVLPGGLQELAMLPSERLQTEPQRCCVSRCYPRRGVPPWCSPAGTVARVMSSFGNADRRWYALSSSRR